MRFAIAALIALGTAALPASSVVQEPVHPVDLEVVSLDAAPALPGQIVVTVGLLFVKHGPAATYDTNLLIELDGMPAADVPLYIEAAESVCDVDPDCNDVCDVQVTGGVSTFVNCQMWDTWGPPGAGCDPYDPSHTCVPVTVCACHAPFTVEATLDGDGSEFIVTSVDFNGGVTEADETNNTLMLMPTPIPSITWGEIKARHE